MTLSPDVVDPNSDLRRKARANVATFEPLTEEELAELSRLFAGTNVPQSIGGTAERSGGALTAAAGPLEPVAAPRTSGGRRAHTGARRDASFPKS